jgi:hypothetical protein
MMPSVDPFHLKVARIALTVAQEHGFALGGGLALIAHGVLDRPTRDVVMRSVKVSSLRVSHHGDGSEGQGTWTRRRSPNLSRYGRHLTAVAV